MKLSVVIPVYNVESTLKQCVDSVLRQNYEYMEVILVDDGSPDGCPQICDTYAQNHPQVKAIHQANGGLSAARNVGISIARGEYITFVDSDDWLQEGTYSALMGILDSHPDLDLIEFPIVETRKGRECCTFYPQDHIYETPEDYWYGCYAYKHCYAWNKIYRRELFNGIRYPEGKVFEDIATTPLLIKACRRIATTPQGCYHYVSNPNGICAQASVEEVTFFLQAYLKSKTLFPKESTQFNHVIMNRQIDLCQKGGQLLVSAKDIHIVWNDKQNDIKTILKILLLKTIGFKRLCKILKAKSHW